MCTIEAFSDELLYPLKDDDSILEMVFSGETYPRPEGLQDDEWTLVQRMTGFEWESQTGLSAAIDELESINAISTDFPALSSRTWQQALPIDRGESQDKKSLKAENLTVTYQDGSSDERGLNLGVSSVTKLTGLTTSATQKFQKFVASTRIKMSSNKQLATDKVFTKLNVGNIESKNL
ncbi:Serine/threonine protein kinase [Phytophthora megakarya]|uniref:Serine/threonine protein kinase n=1 Tax=Phytophthora megakarya TaxID=4795 RepID=A0A225WJC3_9STRA|nr:Serine/threonine protein kinase [Phytophthora megakarya]